MLPGWAGRPCAKIRINQEAARDCNLPPRTALTRLKSFETLLQSIQNKVLLDFHSAHHRLYDSNAIKRTRGSIVSYDLFNPLYVSIQKPHDYLRIIVVWDSKLYDEHHASLMLNQLSKTLSKAIAPKAKAVRDRRQRDSSDKRPCGIKDHDWDSRAQD